MIAGLESTGHSSLLRLKRGPSLRDVPLPTAIVTGKPVPTEQQEEALIRVGDAAVAGGVERLDAFAALSDIIMRRPPRIRGITHGQPIQTTDLDVTIPETHGLFIEESRRMHPTVCRFISDTIYQGRLGSVPQCARQRIICSGWPTAGIRFRPVVHEGNSQRSVEEAEVIASDVADLP